MKASNSEWIGQEIAEGRYKILGRIGQGSMGHIYCAFDRHLETDVVLKFPVSSRAGRTDDRASSTASAARSAHWSSSVIRISSRSSTSASSGDCRSW